MDFQDGDLDRYIPDDLSSIFPPGTDEDMIAGMYNNPELFENYMQQLQLHYNEMQQNYSVYEECAVPVVTQSVEQMWNILLYCFILRCLAKLATFSKYNKSHLLIHLVSILLGCASMWKFYGPQTAYIVIPTLLFLPLFRLHGNYRGLGVCCIATAYLVTCEFFLLDAADWNKVKGSVMIAMMKGISVVFDEERSVTPSNILELYGYLFNPAGIIFGPFITYKNYLQIFQSHKMGLSWLLNSLRTILLCVMCLLWSSCGISNYLSKASTYVPVLEDNRWWRAYEEAQSFRFSHYFVCYFSEAACLIAGIATINLPRKKREKENGDGVPGGEEEQEDTHVSWSFPVATILPVEMPGSLVDVVTNWNLPMHYWLKTYIYKSTHRFGVFVAILLTYIASSILHGFNFQLSAVLLSIGMFAYVESVTRHLLSSMLNACIEARPCRENCTHSHKRKNYWVRCVNLVFSFVAVWNLAYLGCLFDNSAEEEAGYSMAHALRKWQTYNYLNHWLILMVFIVQAIASTQPFVYISSIVSPRRTNSHS